MFAKTRGYLFSGLLVAPAALAQLPAPAAKPGTTPLVAAAGRVVHSPGGSVQLIPYSASALAPPSEQGMGSGGFFPLGQGIEGDQPEDVVLALGGDVAVVALRDTNSLEFFNSASGARLGQVQVPAGPVDLELSPDGTQVLVACNLAGRLAVVDVMSRSVVREINVSAGPYQVAALSDGVRAVVGCNQTASFGAFDVIDWTSGSTIRSFLTPSQVPVAAQIAPWSGIAKPFFGEFAVTPNDRTIVFPSFSDRSIRAYSVATGSEIFSSGPLVLTPVRVAIAPSGAFAVFSSLLFTSFTNELTHLDLTTFQMRGMATGADYFLSDLAILPGEQRLLVGSGAGTLEVDVPTGQVIQTLPIGGVIAEIAITSDGAHALVGRAGYSVVELASMTVVADLPGQLFPRIAVHPNTNQAVAVYPVAHERLEAASTAGPAAQRTWTTELGVPDEVDAPYALALTPDQQTVVATCPLSQNLAVVDVRSGALLDVIPVNGQAHALAIAPDSRQVLVSLDEVGAVAIVDLQLRQVVAEIPVPGSPREVFITPDGTRGIVRSQISGDGYITLLNLAGAGTVVIGSMSANASAWFHSALSPDGATLGCVAFDEVTLIDTATASIRAVIPTALGTGRGFWSHDSVHFGWRAGVDDLHVATLGAGTLTTQVFASTGLPMLGGAFDESGTYVYQLVGGQKVHVYDMATGMNVRTVQLPGAQGATSFYPTWLEGIGDQLLIVRTQTNAAILRLRMAGPATDLMESIDIPNEGTYGFALADALGRVILPASTNGDGLRVIEFGGSTVDRCFPAAPNSTGAPGLLAVSGPLLAADVPVRLDATSLPPFTFGFFIVSRSEGSFLPAGGQGTICLGGNIGRLVASIASTGASGSLGFDLDLATLPLPAPADVMPGDTLYFQAWHRDHNPATTSNLTHSVGVTFR